MGGDWYFLNGTERGKQSLDASLRQLELCLPPKGVEEEEGGVTRQILLCTQTGQMWCHNWLTRITEHFDTRRVLDEDDREAMMSFQSVRDGDIIAWPQLGDT